MKIDQLEVSAVRDDRPVRKLTSLSGDSLSAVVGGAQVDDGGDDSQNICEIHFYYPADTLA